LEGLAVSYAEIERREKAGEGALHQSKASLRLLARARRDALDALQRNLWSASIAETVLASDAWERARWVALYASFGSEVGTQDLLAAALSQQKRLALPRLEREGGLWKISLREHTANAAVEVTGWGITQPTAQANPVASEAIDLWLIPGLAFDPRGVRLGWGRGYYDRLLSVAPGAKVGVAFEIQRFNQLPSEPHDVRLEALVTERGWLASSLSAPSNGETFSYPLTDSEGRLVE
jgi:5-formyltetrahydrofolate cyclo-ligase